MIIFFYRSNLNSRLQDSLPAAFPPFPITPSVCFAAGDERFFTIQSLRQGGHPYTPPARTQRLVLRLPHPVLPESPLHQDRQRIHFWKNAARKRNNPHRLHLLRHGEEKETKNLRLHILRLQKLRNHTEKRKNRIRSTRPLLITDRKITSFGRRKAGKAKSPIPRAFILMLFELLYTNS